MQRSAFVSLTDEAVADPHARQLGVADIGEQALAPAKDLHDEVDGAAGRLLAWMTKSLVQITLLVWRERVQPGLLAPFQAQQPSQTLPRSLGWSGGAGSGQRSRNRETEAASVDRHGHMMTRTARRDKARMPQRTAVHISTSGLPATRLSGRQPCCQRRAGVLPPRTNTQARLPAVAVKTRASPPPACGTRTDATSLSAGVSLTFSGTIRRPSTNASAHRRWIGPGTRARRQSSQ